MLLSVISTLWLMVSAKGEESINIELPETFDKKEFAHSPGHWVPGSWVPIEQIDGSPLEISFRVSFSEQQPFRIICCRNGSLVMGTFDGFRGLIYPG